MQQPFSIRHDEDAQCETALDCMIKALSILDALGHAVAAAHLNLAVEVLQGRLDDSQIEVIPED